MSRLFTFGCSFTKYGWPTWADIVAKEFDEYQNWGMVGGGNSYIVYSLIEAIKQNSIGKDDTVGIMWTNIAREDRWLNGEWQGSGNVYSSSMYDLEWVKKYADNDGYLIRDLANVSIAKRLLDSIGCNYFFLSMLPFTVANDQGKVGIVNKINLLSGIENLGKELTVTDKAISLYRDELATIKPSIFETVFNNNWFSRRSYTDPDREIWFYTSYKNSQSTWAKHWPDINEFLNGNANSDVELEILNFYHVTSLSKLKDMIEMYEMRDDCHPTPVEHLEYLDKVLNIKISNETRQWVNNCQKQIMTTGSCHFNQTTIKRL